MATPAPEVIQSLPPVTIQHIAEGPNPWFAFAVAIAVSVVAVIIAVITLTRVNAQIRLANRQIDLANEQLSTAREELTAVKDDLAVATEMKSFALRAPQLTLKWFYQGESNQLFEGTREYYRDLLISIGIPNTGSKVARDVAGELLFREDTLFASKNARQKVVNNETYIRYDFSDEPFRISPGNHFARQFRLKVRPGLTKLPFLWRIFDDEYAYPISEWGREVIELQLPPIR